MIIEKNISKYIIFGEDSLINALKRMCDNGTRFIFSVTESGILEGLLTDGDLRHCIVKEKSLNLNQPVNHFLNRNYKFAHIDDDPRMIQAHFTEKIQFVPLLDKKGRLVAIARKQFDSVEIGPFTIDDDAPTFIIAEIGINHNGSLELAKQLIDKASEAGANCAKFQMRDLATLYRNAGDAQDASEDLGSQYILEILSEAQLTQEEMYKAFDYCNEVGILPLCTPWDATSLVSLEKYGLLAYKIASADFTNHDFIRAVADTGKPLLCSTGMSTEDEIVETVGLLKQIGAMFVLLHCNSTYPAPFKDLNLNYLERLKEIGECPIGYSGHERGVHVALAAVAKGARVIEKHITIDKSLRGNDHKVSLLPDEFRDMVNGIREIEQAMGSAMERKISQGELMNRENLSKSLVVNCDLIVGDIITVEMLDVKSPGKGLQPNRKKQLIGLRAKRNFKPGDFFYLSDLISEDVVARRYNFRRPWGVPVRYHDFQTLLAKSNPDFLEFHLSYKDMEQDPQNFIAESYDLDLVVHSPDLFAGDHILNLCAIDEKYRKRSVDELQRVIDLTRMLKPRFKRAVRPFIVASLGGFTQDEPAPASDLKSMYELIALSLSELDREGVEIIAQTLPPFPWYFGGQLYLNLFVDPLDTAEFCASHGLRLCLDTSHSKLACNHFKWSFKEFIDCVAPHSAHLHIADAKGVDGEGLQINEGDIDFPDLTEKLDLLAPRASFIPEIWQGHKNEGEGFWVALDRLEGLFC